MQESFSFGWLQNRVEKFGWELVRLKGTMRGFLGPGVPFVMVEVENKRVAKRWADVFDECAKEIFDQSIYDGTEK